MSDVLNLAETSVLGLGSHGFHRGRSFEIIGRTCILSEAGGLWNEHRIVFAGPRGTRDEYTLAEAHGSFAIYAETDLPPVPKGSGPGDWIDKEVVIVERGVAERAAVWGDVPKAKKSYRYLDLSSKKGDLATIAERKYRGTRVELADLELPIVRARPSWFPAPKGAKGKRTPRLVIPIGAEGKLAGTKWRVIGALGRENDGFRWQEYVLHDAAMGFRWLARGEDPHDKWILVKRIEPGLVTDREETARYERETYAYASGGTAKVEWAAGELPWQCAIGDTATVHDFEADTSPRKKTLSFEGTDDEISWSAGETISGTAVAKAFKLSKEER